MKTATAYPQNDQAVVVERLRRHILAGELKRMTNWDGNNGGAIACISEGGDGSEIGLTRELADLVEFFFAHLPAGETTPESWVMLFLGTLKPQSDITSVCGHFNMRLLSRVDGWLERIGREKMHPCRQTIECTLAAFRGENDFQTAARYAATVGGGLKDGSESRVAEFAYNIASGIGAKENASTAIQILADVMRKMSGVAGRIGPETPPPKPSWWEKWFRKSMPAKVVAAEVFVSPTQIAINEELNRQASDLIELIAEAPMGEAVAA